jgi:hypothetical protein
MGRLEQPLKAWHGLLAVLLALALGVSATAVATGGSSGAPTARAGKVTLGKDHGYTYVRQRLTNSGNSVDQGVVGCGRHKVIVSGGGLAYANNNADAQALNSSYPHDDGDRAGVPDGWAIFMDNKTNEDLDAWVYAICKKVG